jgi:hypothetical protein
MPNTATALATASQQPGVWQTTKITEIARKRAESAAAAFSAISAHFLDSA